MTTASTKHHTREIEIDRLTVDPTFAALFIEEPATIRWISASMRESGFEPHRPIDVWKDGGGRGKHVVIEGHQRLAAARAAGLTTVRIAYRHHPDSTDALLWAARERANRRNASRETQCLSVLRALQRAGAADDFTRSELADRLGFGDATIGRAQQVLARGTESEVTAVLEGTHGLKKAYELILRRERTEAEPIREDGEPITGLPEPVEDSEDDDDDHDVPEGLAYARELTHSMAGRVDRLQDILEARTTDAVADVKRGSVTDVLAEIEGLTAGVRQALEAPPERLIPAPRFFKLKLST